MPVIICYTHHKLLRWVCSILGDGCLNCLGSHVQGWGIVEFEKPEEAAAAIQQLDRSEVRSDMHCLALPRSF